MRCGQRQARRMTCTSRKPDGREWSLEGLIEAYQLEYATARAKGEGWWANAPSPEEAVVRAFYDWEEESGSSRRTLNSHQYRIGYDAIQQAAAAAVRKMPLLLAAEDFDQLLSAFRAIWKAEGLFADAALLTYDVAERFGRYRDIRPTKVYLHAGAAEGARAMGVKGQAAEPQRFGPLLARLPPSEIENFLCICKANLRSMMFAG